jgi:hypothetical protein
MAESFCGFFQSRRRIFEQDSLQSDFKRIFVFRSTLGSACRDGFAEVGELRAERASMSIPEASGDLIEWRWRSLFEGLLKRTLQCSGIVAGFV